MSKSTFKNKNIWITGASSGIGEALVLSLVKLGANIIVSSRRAEALEEVREKCGALKEQVHIQVMDLESEENVKKASQTVLSTFNELDYVFLNGGFSQRSFTHETPIEIDRRLMEVNFFGNIAITKELLPAFIKQKHGHFVVTSSIAGVFGFPLRSSYSASKHALHGYFDTLRAEHKKNNILVTIACPGRIKTNISINALNEKGEPTGILDNAQKFGMTAEVCANKMLSGVGKKKKEMYIGGKEILMVYFKRFFPGLYYHLAATQKTN